MSGSDNILTNEALGGAVYNTGDISGNIKSDFAGNTVRTEVVTECTMFFSSANDELHVTSSALGGAVYNKGNISADISGDFVNNSAYAIFYTKGGTNDTIDDSNGANTNSRVIPTEYIQLLAKGGAVYNTAAIGTITGNYIGNSARSQVSMAPHGAANFALIHGTYDATGGAIYNGVDGLTLTAPGGSAINSSINGIANAVFVGNYAYNYHLTQQGPNVTSLSRSKYAPITTYAAGGAIYNGIERFDNTATSVNSVSSSIGAISGIFVDNFAYDIDPFLCGESWEESRKGYYHYQLGDWYTDKKHNAAGGAIYNGVSGGNVIAAELTATITSIAGEFTGNYTYIKDYKSQKEGTSNAIGGSPSFDKTTARLYSSGGAVYNGLAGIDIASDGAVSSTITGGIVANFTGNYAFIMRQHGLLYGEDGHTAGTEAGPGGIGYGFEQDYATGGAIHNGVADISTASSHAVTASIGNLISGNFTDNYASVKGCAYVAPTFALGGAIYNGVHYTSFGGESIRGDIQSVIALIDNSTFTGNYAYIWNYSLKYGSSGYRTPKGKTDYSLGGAIYNGIIGISGDTLLTEGKVQSLINVIGSIGNDNSPTVSFINNKAHTYNEMYKSDKSNLSHFALGGAIYNGIERISNTAQDTVISADIKHITANFSGNYVQNELKYESTYNAFGGAIYNGHGNASDFSGSLIANIDTITGDFTENAAKIDSSSSSSYAYARGGAIANANREITSDTGTISAHIGAITGNFKENYVSSLTEALGGAIYNGNRIITDNTINVIAKIDSITGDFIGNYLESKSISGGGAIYNGNENITERGSIAKIGTITGDFIDNHAHASSGAVGNYQGGGAIYNFYGYIDSITGYFINNKADGDATSVGGAIANGAGALKQGAGADTHIVTDIDSITGDFTGNMAKGGSVVMGGSVMNGIGYLYLSSVPFDNANGDLLFNIDKIAGCHVNNSAVASSSNGSTFGGAIGNGIAKLESSASFNNSNGNIKFSIGAISDGFFIDNEATANGTMISVYGGAIANGLANVSPSQGINNEDGVITMAIGCIDSEFTRNHVSIGTPTAYTEDAKGGAIFNGIGSYSSSGLFNNTNGIFETRIDKISGNFTNNSAETVNRVQSSSYYNNYTRGNN